MMTFVTRLPEEAHYQRFSVLAPQNGVDQSLEQMVDDLNQGIATSISLVVLRDDIEALIQIPASSDTLSQDPVDDTVYHIERSIGSFIDEDGGITENRVGVAGYINTQVTVSHTTAGLLVLWSVGPDSQSQPISKE